MTAEKKRFESYVILDTTKTTPSIEVGDSLV